MRASLFQSCRVRLSTWKFPDTLFVRSFQPGDRICPLGLQGSKKVHDVFIDAKVLAWIRRQAEGACSIFSVCTGALLCGAAGLLKGRRATTHWASFHLLPFFGAIPVNERVVVDGSYVFAAGVTAGIDGALCLAAELRGDDAARTIQLYMAYAPEPPFNSGTPETAPPAILQQTRESVQGITAQREATARRVAARLGIVVPR